MYQFMTKQEIEIAQITHLKMIHLYQLGSSDAIAVYYDNNKQMNLCSMDEGYPALLKKVLQLYAECTDKNSIIMDSNTQALFENTLMKEVPHTSFYHRIGKHYQNMESTFSPKFASECVLRETLTPLLKYYLKQLYHMWNVTVVFEEEPLGWHRNCVFKLQKKKETLLLPIRMTPTGDNEFCVTIGNFLQDLCKLTFEISYKENLLFIRFESEEFKLFGESRFEVTFEAISAYTTIWEAGQIVYHQKEPIEYLTNFERHQKQFLHLNIDFTNATICRLPWGGHIMIRQLKQTGETYQRTDYDTIFWEEYRSRISLHLYSHSLVENMKDGLRLRSDGAIMNQLYYGDKRREVETHFLPAGYYSGWDYKTYLENRYFYNELEDTNHGVIE